EQLATLLETQTGAHGVSLALTRTGQPAPSRLTAPVRAAVEVEAGLSLSAHAADGDEIALRRGLEQAARVVNEWMREPRAAREFQFLEPGAEEPVRLLGEIVGVSEAAREFVRSVRRFADLELTIAIVGESGSGKDFAARALHAQSHRARGEHVVVDCATLRRETAASELFGHVRGAFTGATADHAGLLARSHNGTLQLDNVAELSPDLQALLLRALEERRITPVGGQRETAFDARVLVTSQRSLEALVAEKRLRLDFAQRLGGLTLNVPPLRERRGDALLLAEVFLAEQSAMLGRALRLDALAREAIERHAWPGNVRELRSAVARACALADGAEIRAGDLVAARRESGNPLLALPREKGLKSGARVMLALARSLGEITPREAAAALGVSRTTASLTLTALARADSLERTGRGRSTGYRVPG
ncbi:partial Regulatory protein AtoC, partial [uncultured bacterium]